jgi:pimeloyl-ACP methyl ester carboxylesterase
MPLLAQRHTVIVPDLRGAGDSSKPESGYDKKNMAVDIHELTSTLSFHNVAIVGHDIGLMVAYAYAAQFPQDTERVVLMDAFLPGIGDWKSVWLMRDLWHFHFYGTTPLALVKGRERTYFEHFWNDFAADPMHSIPEADRRIYAAAYAQEGGMRAGFEYFRNFEKDAADFAQLGTTKLTMPVLVLTGEKASGEFLIEQTKLVATDVRGQVIKGSGHWLMEEAPDQVIPALVAFLSDGSNAALNQRAATSWSRSYAQTARRRRATSPTLDPGTCRASIRRMPRGVDPACSSRSDRTTRRAPGAACPRPGGSGCRPRPPAP